MNLAETLQAKVAEYTALVAKVSAWVLGPPSGAASLVDFGGGLVVKTIARLCAAVDDAVQYGVAGPPAWSPPVPWAVGLVCVVGPPATAVTFANETYVCKLAHTAIASDPDFNLKWTKIATKGADGANGLDGVGGPLGRLTLVSGEAVMTSNQTAKTMLYYTPRGGGLAPIWDGTKFVLTPFAELSNDLTQSATGKAGPVAAGPYQVIDGFVWDDAGTRRLTRGPCWNRSATVTISIATPAVVGWVAHGLYDGATFRMATTGALPTGVAAGSDYFVAVIDADTFKLSTSLANQVVGTFINTTGSQSGTHSASNFTTARGTGAGTTELELLNGLWVNKNDITNGPLARRGLYVGSILTDGNSQANWHTGGVGAGGTAAILGVWNAFNRMDVRGFIGDNANTWAWAAASYRPANGSPTIRATVVQGLREEFLTADYKVYRNDGGSSGFIGIGYNSTANWSGRPGYMGATSVTLEGSAWHATQPFGAGYATPLERGDGTNVGTFFGDNGGVLLQSGMFYGWRC